MTRRKVMHKIRAAMVKKRGCIPIFPVNIPVRNETVGVARDAIAEYTVLTRAM